MNYKDFKPILERDGGRCYHCGLTGDTLVPQHRAGRGMGGTSKKDNPANLIAFCSIANGMIEANSEWAENARAFGWKIHRWQDPEQVAVKELWSGLSWLLAADGTRTLVK